MNCEKCDKEHDGKYGSGRFCSRQCANSRDRSVETRLKIGRALTKLEILSIICQTCGKIFETKNKKRTSCSMYCFNNREFSIETREKISKAARISANNRYARNDQSIGWKTRHKTARSYPEIYFKNFLDFAGLKYEPEFPAGRFFIDFAFIDKKIALEIDGRRHHDIDVKLKDDRKDAYLESHGWRVFRIKWRNPKSEPGKRYLEEKKKEFVALLV